MTFNGVELQPIGPTLITIPSVEEGCFFFGTPVKQMASGFYVSCAENDPDKVAYTNFPLSIPKKQEPECDIPIEVMR